MAGVLSHITVLDLSRILAGPWAAQTLADLGADVIKVEQPRSGDDSRTWGPPFMKDKDGRTTSEGGYFLAANRGKKSVTVNIATPEGQQIVKTLASEVDVVIENFKAGTLERYGLGHRQLCALNPRLVYCSITGFGQDGPRAAEPAYDFLIQAIGGLMSVTGERGGAPQKVGVPIVDLVTGAYATVGILAALTERALSGRGRYIDLAMLDVQVNILSTQAMNYLVSGKTPQRTGTAHPNIQPQQVFSARDGEFVIVVGNDSQFASLCETVGHPEFAEDERFKTNGERVAHREVLTPMLERAFAQKDRAYWMEALKKGNVPCGSINSVPEVFADPQVVHQKLLHRMQHPDFGDIHQVAGPLKFDGVRPMSDRAPPSLGSDTDAVLQSIGITAEQIEAMRARGIV